MKAKLTINKPHATECLRIGREAVRVGLISPQKLAHIEIAISVHELMQAGQSYYAATEALADALQRNGAAMRKSIAPFLAQSKSL